MSDPLYSATILSRISEVSEAEWDSLVPAGHPFLSWRFLNALEDSGCAVEETGWGPRHIWLMDEDGSPVGAAPLYAKSHSRGEYVFDHGWADALYRAGGEYYPKLQGSIPFTPATGPRLLAKDTGTKQAVATAMAADDDLIIYYEQELEDAAVFARGSGSDAFVRRFMVQRQYTEATESADVSDMEVAEFREYVAPRLIQMADNEPTFEQWQNEGVAALDQISTWEMIKEDSGLLDLLFAALGIGTAFRLGSQMG